jgi:hypothetical protein
MYLDISAIDNLEDKLGQAKMADLSMNENIKRKNLLLLNLYIKRECIAWHISCTSKLQTVELKLLNEDMSIVVNNINMLKAF